MSNKKNICLLGFSKEVEEKIKATLSHHASNYSFEWKSANDKNLDGVIINSAFIEAPQIQKYISLVKAPVVCSHSNEEGRKLAEKHAIPSFANNNESPSSAWFSKLLGEPFSVTTQTTSPVTDAHATTEKTNKKSIKSDYNEVLKNISTGKTINYLAKNGENTTWIKPAEGVVYINYPREKVLGFDQWDFEEQSKLEIPAYARQLKLDLWLFETLWQSHLNGKDFINEDAYFRLLRWPQPLSRQGRTEALRLAASAQGYPTNIQTLFSKTNYPLEHIHRFLFATLSAGQTEEVHEKIKEPAPRAVEMDEKKREEKKSFLRRFREKLGL